MSLRILGGIAKGRALRVPESARPTGARLRKSLFDLLSHHKPEGRFLDLHGGSGAIGLEAASRGYQVTLIEQDLRAVKQLEQNARALELKVTVTRGDALKMARQMAQKMQLQDIVFSDPPYQTDIATLSLELLNAEILAADGLLICQHPSQITLPEHPNHPNHPNHTLEVRKYGSNVLSIYRK